MRVCKNCGPLDDAEFCRRKSGYTPHLCRRCEREEAKLRRRRRYADPVGHREIDASNAKWRKLNRKSRRNSHDSTLFASLRKDGCVPELVEDVNSIFERFSRTKIRNPLPQSPCGLNYLDAVIAPHRFDAKTEGFMSMNEALNDDETLGKVIDYITESGREPSKDLVLRNLKFITSMPSHFFPETAVALCREFAGGKDVLDPFAGWGGRALGAYAANVRSLTALDLQPDSILGCDRIDRDFSALVQTRGTFVCGDSIKYLSETDRKFGFIMMSPPFIGTENYGSAPFSSQRDWTQSLIVPFVSSVGRVLLSDGVVAIHVQDRPKVPVLSIVLPCFQLSGFELCGEYKYGKRRGQSVLILRRKL